MKLIFEFQLGLLGKVLVFLLWITSFSPCNILVLRKSNCTVRLVFTQNFEEMWKLRNKIENYYIVRILLFDYIIKSIHIIGIPTFHIVNFCIEW